MTIQQTLLSNSTSSFNNWQANSVRSSSYFQGPYYVTSASDNIYVSTDTVDPALFGVLTKYNKFGSITFQKTLSNMSNLRKINIDSSDNIYTGGYYLSGANTYTGVVKLNSSGTVQWSKSIGAVNNDLFLFSTVIDSSNNIYALILKQSPYGIVFAKFDSSGAIQFQKKLSGSGGNSITGYSMAIDSSDNIYIVGYSAPGTVANRVGALYKYNTSGTLQWQKYLQVPSGSYILFDNIGIDYADNIYVLAETNYSTAAGYAVIIKFDTSGNLIWNYYILNMSFSGSYSSLSFDIANNIYISSNNNILKIDGNSDKKWGIIQTVSGG
jgi:hypothetical protein